MVGIGEFVLGFSRIFSPNDGKELDNTAQQSTEEKNSGSLASFIELRERPDTDSDNEKQSIAVSYENWNRQQKTHLTEFVTKRLIGDRDESETETEEVEVPANDALSVPLVESQQVHTQPILVEDSTLKSPRTPPKRKQVPSVDETTKTTSSLDDIDLYTKEANLNLLRIENVWGLRSCKRQKEARSIESFESDGPLASACKVAFSIEVVQLKPKDTEELEEVAAAAFNQQKPNRMRIFFYNKYARRISEFFNEAPKDATMLLSLSRIPAICIFPFEINPTSWFDTETLTPYCCCIADSSCIRWSDDLVGFESQELSLLLAYSHTGRMRGETISKEVSLLSNNGGYDEIEGRFGLVSEYNKWIESQVNKKDVSETSATKRRASLQNSEDSPLRKRPKTPARYEKLGNLVGRLEDHQKDEPTKDLIADIYCAVIGFGCPFQTKRGDWMISMTVVDETLPLPSRDGNYVKDLALTVLVFCKQKGMLPVPYAAGDVLRCHRVAVQMWQGEVQIVGRHKSSFVVIRPKEAQESALDDPSNWSILPTAKHSFTWETQDQGRSIELWNWAQERILSYPTILRMEHRFKLEQMRRSSDPCPDANNEISYDLTAMVVAIIPVEPEHLDSVTPRGFLRVWDGTGAPSSDPLPLATPAASESVRLGDPPSTALVAIQNTVRALDGIGKNSCSHYNAAPTRFSLSCQLDSPKKLCGCVVNVAIWEEPHWDLVKRAVCVGGFLRFRNIAQNEIADGLRCLSVHAKSQLTPLPKRTFEIRTLLEEHQARILRNHMYNPQSGVLPLGSGASPRTGWQRQGASALESIIGGSHNGGNDNGRCKISECISAPHNKSYLVDFRILKTTPDVSDDEIGLKSLCVSSGSKKAFQFVVRLSDGSSEIDALVSDDLAATLLGRTADEAFRSTLPATEIVHIMTRNDVSWHGRLRSILFHGVKFFVLESASIETK